MKARKILRIEEAPHPHSLANHDDSTLMIRLQVDPSKKTTWIPQLEFTADGLPYCYESRALEDLSVIYNIQVINHREAISDNLAFFPKELNILVTDGEHEMKLRDLLLMYKDRILRAV